MARLYIFKNDKSIMKNLSKHEFEIYCLLFAADADFDITKQELIAIGSHTDPVTFVRIYNGFEADTDRERTTTLQECITLYIKDELDRQNHFDSIKKVFFTDGRNPAAEHSIFKTLREIIK